MFTLSCSVCAVSSSHMMGGVLLWERNTAISAICNDCWINFSNKKQVKTEAQKQALMHNIGVESQLYHRVLPINKTFQDNVQDAQTKLKIKSFQINPILIQNNTTKITKSLSQGKTISVQV